MRRLNFAILASVVLVILLASLAPSQSPPPPTGNASRLRGRNIATTAPGDTQVLTWDAASSSWKPAPGGSGTAGTGITISGGVVALDTTYAANNFALLAPASPQTITGVWNVTNAGIVFTPGAITSCTAPGALCMSAGDLLNYNDSVNVRVLAGVPGTGTTLPSAPTVGHLATWGAGFTLADGGAVTGPCTGTASAFQYNNSGAFGCAPLTYTVPAANQNLFTFTQGSDPSTPLISLNSSGGTPVWRLGIQSTAAFEGAFSPVIRLYSDNFATSVVALYGGVGGGQIFFANGGGTNWSSTGDTGGSSDTGQHRVAPGVIGIDNGTSGTFTEAKLRSLVHGGSVPGISGCSADTQVGGNTAGSYTSRTSGTCTVTLTFAFTAPTGWACATNDLTTPADVQHQSGVASRTTTATITGTTVTGDVVNFDCHAY